VPNDKTALVIFVDIRGFTKWSEVNEVFINLDHFITGYLDILRKYFPEGRYELMPRGDGAILIYDLPSQQTQREVAALLARVLKTIDRVEKDFQRHCENFGRNIGHETHLNLGWGIVRGKILKVGDDWAGHNLNKCSRLCGEARPYGIVIDRDDFPGTPPGTHKFVAQVRRLQGIGEVSVWVTNEIAFQFIPRERLRETPEVHVAGVCFIEEVSGRIRVLFARRSLDRDLFPGKLEGCGGQLRHSETFADGIQRHFRLELGIDVEVLTELHYLYEIREPNSPVIPGIRFLCRRIGDGEPRSANHSNIRWATEDEIRGIPDEEFVGELKLEILDLLQRYRERQ
jgi:class 3 adenylate cyclase